MYDFEVWKSVHIFPKHFTKKLPFKLEVIFVKTHSKTADALKNNCHSRQKKTSLFKKNEVYTLLNIFDSLKALNI